MGNVNVVLTGQLLEDADFATAVDKMAAMTRLDRAKIERLLSSGKTTVIKKEVSPEVGEKYRVALTGIGVAVELRVSDQGTSASPFSPSAAAAAGQKADVAAPAAQKTDRESDAVSAPKVTMIGVAPPVDEGEQETNPYAAPQADLGVMGDRDGAWLSEPKKVPASHGWLWFKEAVAMFREEPWRWSGLVVLSFIPIFLVSLIPIIGSLIASLIGPIVAGGLLLGAQAQTRGEVLPMATVLRGFQEKPIPLLLIGVFYFVGFMLIGIVVMLIAGGGMLGAFLGAGGAAGNSDAVAAAMLQNLPVFAMAFLVGGGLSIPLLMAYWFAPCLVVLTDESAWASYAGSLRATSRNWLPFLVYGLVLFLFFLVIGIGFGLLAGLFGVIFSNSLGGVLFLLPVLAILLLGIPTMAVITLSIYTGFRDIFYDEG